MPELFWLTQVQTYLTKFCHTDNLNLPEKKLLPKIIQTKIRSLQHLMAYKFFLIRR